MEKTKLFKNKMRAIVLSLMTILAISAPGIASAGLCDDMAKGTGGFLSCGNQATTSFTQFTGTLSAPDATKYAPGLSQNTNLRDYIKNVVNFGLGFLGILAVVIVIYGGFLYVTAAGKEEQAGNGKKTITYAVIGILIILSSFALVNTVLLAGGGTDKGADKPAAPGGTGGLDANAQRQALFAYAGSMVKTVAHDLVTAYQNYYEIKGDIEIMNFVDVSTSVQSVQDLQTYLGNLKSSLTNIVTKAGAISQVADKGTAAINSLNAWLSLKSSDLGGIVSETDQHSGWTKFWSGANSSDLKNTITTAIDPLKEANKADFAQAVGKAHDKLVELYTQINAGGGVAAEVITQFQTVVNTDLNGLVALDTIAFAPSFNLENIFFSKAFALSASLTLNEAKATNQNILQIVNDLSTLYDLVKDMQFVYSVITADKSEGNAPLLVNFDGLKSLDPNNVTIPSGSFAWDFGDGATGTEVTQSHIYTKPGTFIVRLNITAPDAPTNLKKAANGIAYKTITVRPASSRIDLVATINGEDYPLSKYEGTNQVVDADVLPVTTKEALNGITFKADGTTVGTGNDAKPLKSASDPAHVFWDFGDKSLGTADTKDGLPSDANLTVTDIKYKNAGTYRVLLQVRDEKGVLDSKFVNVNVSPIVSRIKVGPSNAGYISQEFAFDGSSSSSDSSKITTYTWTVQKDEKGSWTDVKDSDGTVFNPGNIDNFKYTFSRSGKYKVTLQVSDGANDSTVFPTFVTVKSKPSISQFNYTNTDPTRPNVYVFDGAGSYDPDAYDGEVLSYSWEVNPPDCVYYKWDTTNNKFDNSKELKCADLKKDTETGAPAGYNKDNPRIKVKFNSKNKYTVSLDAQDIVSDIGNSTPLEQDVSVDNILDVAWGGIDNGAAIVCNLGQTSGDKKCTATSDGQGVTVAFTVYTENGVSCDIDTGDGGKEHCASIDPATHSATVTHDYTQAGSYKVKLTVYDANDNGNATYRKVFVGGGTAPIAAFALNKNGDDLSLSGDPKEIVDGNRKTVFIFDATPSINLDGSHRNLNYSWDFGDGSEKSTKKTVTHLFADPNKEATNSSSPDYVYPVTLSVADQDSGKTSVTKDSVNIHIRKEPPTISGIVAIPAGSSNITPVTVNLSAAGANDADGKIVSYKWWYYQVSPTPSDLQLGVQITAAPNVALIIGTNGLEKDKHTYKFGVIATDNEGQTSSDLNPDTIPSVDVVDGPNKAPVAKFSVDRTSINVGESVNFSSSSTDPDKGGSILHYMWNFGTGYTNPDDKDYDKVNVTYTFTKPAKDGVEVRLKVRDNNGAEAVSDPVKIFVDSKSNPPVAAFTSEQLPNSKKIQFTSKGKSTADEANGAKLISWAWDFDIKVDFNGDGIPDNDVQSTDQNPAFEYPEYNIYRAKLTVTDDQGNSANVSNFVNVKAPVVTPPPVTPPTTPTVLLQARLLTNPATSVVDNRIHLQGDSADVALDFSTSTGAIASYWIDKNIFYDSNGDANTSNDHDYEVTKPGTWTTKFFRSYGKDTVRLTVVDAKGKTSQVDKEIVFDPIPAPVPAPTGGSTTPVTPTTNKNGQPTNQLQAYVLAGYEVVDWQLLLVSVAGFGIFIVSTLNKKKHARNKSQQSE